MKRVSIRTFVPVPYFFHFVLSFVIPLSIYQQSINKSEAPSRTNGVLLLLVAFSLVKLRPLLLRAISHLLDYKFQMGGSVLLVFYRPEPCTHIPLTSNYGG